MSIGAVVLAAGGSVRFGRPKQLAIFQGEPLVRRSVAAAKNAGCAPVVVVVGPDAAQITPVLAGLPVSIIEHPNWSNGLGSSIAVGLKHALGIVANLDAAILLTCDQPFVNAATLRQLIQVYLENGKPIVASAYAETLGIPALFDRSCFGDLLQLRGDSGAKGIILARRNDVTPFDFPAAAIDIDTAADYEKLRDCKDRVQKNAMQSTTTHCKGSVPRMTNIPRLNFADLPTPIEALPRLSDALGGPRLLIKRDDQTGLAFGGNKTRKLEFLVAEARDQGANTLISGGALQSNHCRQTAAAAARFGFKCILVLTGDEPKQPSANLLLDELFGAEIVYVAERKDRDRILQETFDRAAKERLKPYLVPYGGSNETGALGYAFAMKELVEQNCHADWIVFASSSGGTHAGLLLGQRMFGYKGKMLGISVDETEMWLNEHVSELASSASAKLGKRIDFKPDEVLANGNYCSAGYGMLTDQEREAIRLFTTCEGLLLDPVYTGRAAAGMIDLIRKGFFKKNETVLFLHTGGQPALFADQYANKI